MPSRSSKSSAKLPFQLEFLAFRRALASNLSPCPRIVWCQAEFISLVHCLQWLCSPFLLADLRKNCDCCFQVPQRPHSHLPSASGPRNRLHETARVRDWRSLATAMPSWSRCNCTCSCRTRATSWTFCLDHCADPQKEPSSLHVLWTAELNSAAIKQQFPLT